MAVLMKFNILILDFFKVTVLNHSTLGAMTGSFRIGPYSYFSSSKK